jgi:hypothetical protein
MTGSQTVWLYAVTRGDADSSPPAVRGVAGEDVRILTEGPLTAVVGSVDARRFGPDVLAGLLENLDWLATAARAHDTVVAAAAARGPVVPVRLATLFSSDDGVRELLRGRREDFQSALAAVTGRAEWGVKAYVDPDSLADSLNAPDAATVPTGQSGAGSAYLMRRRAKLAARQSVQSAAGEWAQQIHARLRPLCAASRLHPAQDSRLTGRRDWMILNAAYLVDQDRTDPFHALVRQLTEWQAGLDVELTGPWPPYSFAVPEGVQPGERHD